jgi:hypothetical protein
MTKEKKGNFRITYYHIRVEVFTAVTKKNAVFWDIET